MKEFIHLISRGAPQLPTRSPARRLLPAIAFATPPAISLPYANRYLVTGNYVTGNVDLSQASGGGGFLQGTIHMSGVPANAEILAAHLYWETAADRAPCTRCT
jgi:hypothetical protein